MIKLNKCLYAGGFGVVFVVSAQAQDTIVTDRPDFTESAVVVPKGMVQIESGLTYEKGSDDTHLTTLPELLIRYGSDDLWEWRFELPGYNALHIAGDDVTGFGDASIGFKKQLGPCHEWDVAILGAVSVPTGKEEFTSDEWDPEISLAVGRDLSEDWSLGSMLTVAFPNEGDETLSPTLVFGYAINEQLGAFIEYAGTYSEDSRPQHLAHAGFAYLLDNDTQLDFHFGFGFDDPAPESFIGVGLSLRR